MTWIYNPLRRRPTISDILNGLREIEIDVSKRTIERDIQYLKNKGFIKYSKSKNGYDTPENTNNYELEIFKKIINN